MSESMSLARYDKMCLAIAEARKVDEVKEIRNQAIALEQYARQAKNKDAERHCAEIRIRAERRAGELLTEMDNARTGPKIRYPDGTEFLNGAPTLEELGVSKKQSSKWQDLSRIPVDKFEEVLASGGDIPTTEGVLRKAVAGEQRNGHRRIFAVIEDLIDGQPTIAAPGEIRQADFRDWAPAYEGPKFNLLHCDFPYGIDSDKSGLHPSGYEDSPNVLKGLLDCLEKNFDRLCSRSCHVIFWFGTNKYCETFRFLTERLRLEVEPAPLIWDKSNAGILPDQFRRPRRTYEWALLGWRGDRRLVREGGKANLKNCSPVEGHPHTKPVPMLEHFFGMLVDETTVMLDPTCGSGTAIRVAETLGARYSLGLEKEGEFCRTAQEELQKFRAGRVALQELGIL